MPELAATVLVPTYNHGPLLHYSVRTALKQTVEDLEVFIVCDGATEDTLQAASELAASDERVRVFVNDKGPRNGEVHRRIALEEATGRIVCYLGDDDLFLPNHVEAMAGLLASADFAHSHPVGIAGDGRLFSWAGHFSLRDSRKLMLREGVNFIPLTCAAHTMEVYHRLPFGWRTTPDESQPDLYFWQQILSVEGVRAVSGDEATAIHLPSPQRKDWTLEERTEELERWSAAIKQPDFAAELERPIRMNAVLQWGRSEAQRRRLLQRVDGLETDLSEADARYATVAADRDQLADELRLARKELAEGAELLGRQRGEIASLERRVARLDGRLASMRRSRTWRARALLLRAPGVPWLARRARAR